MLSIWCFSAMVYYFQVVDISEQSNGIRRACGAALLAFATWSSCECFSRRKDPDKVNEKPVHLLHQLSVYCHEKAKLTL